MRFLNFYLLARSSETDWHFVFCSWQCSATVHISVNDVNEYAPKFNQPSYVVDVDEGRPADKIIQVEANDADCSAKYGDICRYDLLNKDQPFAIDNEGLFDIFWFHWLIYYFLSIYLEPCSLFFVFVGRNHSLYSLVSFFSVDSHDSLPVHQYRG